MSGPIPLPAPIAEWVGGRGPCGLCGGPDARHRVLDAIAERVTAGDTIDDTAADYGMPTWVARAVCEHWDPEGQVWS